MGCDTPREYVYSLYRPHVRTYVYVPKSIHICATTTTTTKSKTKTTSILTRANEAHRTESLVFPMLYTSHHGTQQDSNMVTSNFIRYHYKNTHICIVDGYRQVVGSQVYRDRHTACFSLVMFADAVCLRLSALCMQVCTTYYTLYICWYVSYTQ